MLFIVRLFIDALMVLGLAIPFFQIEHARHARALILATLGLAVLCWSIYLVFSINVLHQVLPDRLDVMLLRAYGCSAGLCSLLEEVFSVRDEAKDVRTKILTLYGLFFLLAFLCLAAGFVTTL